jgi:hypothetical protein
MRRNNYLQLIEIVDEALRLLPPTMPEFRKLTIYEHIRDIRRAKRKDASGLKARRSTPNRKWESWVDVQTITLKEEDD